MSEFMSYDPWAEITTRNGYAGDEMVAMLQKAIRRGKEEDALHAAYEMYITSPQFEEKLWRRLLCISVEDIGFGNPDAPNLVYTLFKMRQEFPYNDGDRPMFFVHAIRYLCRQKKERSSDHVKNLLNHEFEAGLCAGHAHPPRPRDGPRRVPLPDGGQPRGALLRDRGRGGDL